MKIRLYIYVVFFIILGCSSKGTKKSEELLFVDSLVNYTSFEKDKFENKDLDVLKLKKGIDSLLISIFNKNICSELIIDTISKWDMIFTELIGTPLENIINNTIKNVKYKFVLNGFHNVDFVILSFTNEYIADSVFNIFEYVANAKKIGAPGLTYSNDYLILIKNEIYWLHTGCSYAYFNHLKFVNILQNMVDTYDYKSIECECGKSGTEVSPSVETPAVKIKNKIP